MTVGELIEALTTYPRNLPVTYVDDTQECEVSNLWIDRDDRDFLGVRIG